MFSCIIFFFFLLLLSLFKTLFLSHTLLPFYKPYPFSSWLSFPDTSPAITNLQKLQARTHLLNQSQALLIATKVCEFDGCLQELDIHAVPTHSPDNIPEELLCVLFCLQVDQQRHQNLHFKTQTNVVFIPQSNVAFHTSIKCCILNQSNFASYNLINVVSHTLIKFCRAVWCLTTSSPEAFRNFLFRICMATSSDATASSCTINPFFKKYYEAISD